MAGHTDTTEALERVLPLAIHYANTPSEMSTHVITNTALTYSGHAVQAMTLAFSAVLGLLVQGHRLDFEISNTLMGLAKSGELPFHTITRDNY